MPPIMHIDMDAFFASIEQLDNPELKGKPVIVGGEVRGVVSAASYEARKFGVHSAMPSATARRLCPEGTFVRGRRERYMEVSRKVMGVLNDFSPLVEAASIDEAYLDAEGMERLFGPPERMALAIKEEVRQATGGLTCSVGLAEVKFLAKIASDINKPDGFFQIPPQETAAFLQRLPVGKLPGVGGKFVQDLLKMGVKTAGDVLRYPEDFWTRRFGKGGQVLFQRANGRDSRKVEPFTAPKSESAENTFAEDTLDFEFLAANLLKHAERVGASLRKQGLMGRTITIKVKYADFQQVTRGKTLNHRTDATETIFKTALALLEQLAPAKLIRLIGLGVSNFEDAPQQFLLTEKLPGVEEEQDRRRLDQTIDNLRGRFGRDVITRGRLFGK